jgi:hypothetical protein
MDNVKETSDALASIGDTIVKLHDAKIVNDDNFQKANDVLGIFLDKLKDFVTNLDLNKQAEPVAQPKAEQQVTNNMQSAPNMQQQPQQQFNQVSMQPQQQQVMDKNMNAMGERLFAGKTFNELNGMNSMLLNQLAQKISQSANANPTVPVQGSTYEDGWRQNLIAYITSNAQYYFG